MIGVLHRRPLSISITIGWTAKCTLSIAACCKRSSPGELILGILKRRGRIKGVGRNFTFHMGGGRVAGRNIWRPFLGRRPTSKIPVRKNFDDLFFFSNFSHFFHTPPTTAPRTLHSPVYTPGVGPPITPGVGPHPTFRGGFSPPQPPLSTPLCRA
jgi:hypothetical protein